MSCSPANLRASAAAAATALALAGCGGGGDRREDGPGDAIHTVRIERASFPARQRVGQQAAFVLTVRNAGDATIRDLVVTLRGFSRHTADTPQRPLWLVDAPPRGSVTAIDDTYAFGALAPNRRTTLRWRTTAVLSGTHDVTVAVAAGVGNGARTQLPGGGPARAKLTIRVAAKPPFARVDPRTGRVIREG